MRPANEHASRSNFQSCSHFFTDHHFSHYPNPRRYTVNIKLQLNLFDNSLNKIQPLDEEGGIKLTLATWKRAVVTFGPTT